MEKMITKDKHKKILLSSIERNGLGYTTKLVGGISPILNILSDGKTKDFYKLGFTKPYEIVNGEMYIDDLIIDTLHLSSGLLKDEIFLGKFNWCSGGMKYCVTVNARPIISRISGLKIWRVIGLCGDWGFGYVYINKKNTIGVRGKTQIYKQIIEQYQLNSYV
jgi:hypothetical protein